jgi:PPM family protein phosphatase
MSLGRIAFNTHPGRKRRRNEDSYVSDPPLFAIADGMGGAHAGALASRLAAGALREREHGDGDGVGAEEQVVSLIQEANRRVYERATADEQATGMGTTMTAAIVEADRVVIGHVGDSRAYLVRDGRIEQVTHDHSLVAELVRSGKISPEEADSHPQRSVITRALGPDPNVDVDTFLVPVQSGDLFLLCSDGLSSMVEDKTIGRILVEHRDDLQQATEALVQAANDAGGEDNITVVCFEIVAAGAPVAVAPGAPAEAEPMEDEEDTLDELDGVPTASITTIRQAPTLEELEREAEPEPDLEPDGAEPARKRRSRVPLYASVIVVLVLLALAALWGFSRSHFVGAQKDGHIAVYQGLPWDITGSIHLYRAVYVSPVLAAQLTQDERKSLFDHDLGDLESKDKAMAKVQQLEQQLGQ